MAYLEEIARDVIFVRRFEEKICELYSSDLIKSPVHLSIGQELLSVSLARLSKKSDRIVGNYRSHALALALSNNRQQVVDELCGLESGMFGGRAGSMHLGVPEEGMIWSSAIVASGIPVAVGIAEAVKRKNNKLGTNDIVICMFGDGAMEEGCFIESINIASTRRLPILFCCEDNGLAIFTRKQARTALTSYTDRVQAWGIETTTNTYKSPSDLVTSVASCIENIREKQAPHFMLTECYRTMEHVGVGYDWDLGYRTKDELDEWEAFDIEKSPVLWGLDEDFVHKTSIKAIEEVNMYFTNAITSPVLPCQRSILNHVY